MQLDEETEKASLQSEVGKQIFKEFQRVPERPKTNKQTHG